MFYRCLASGLLDVRMMLIRTLLLFYNMQPDEAVDVSPLFRKRRPSCFDGVSKWSAHASALCSLPVCMMLVTRPHNLLPVFDACLQTHGTALVSFANLFVSRS